MFVLVSDVICVLLDLLPDACCLLALYSVCFVCAQMVAVVCYVVFVICWLRLASLLFVVYCCWLFACCVVFIVQGFLCSVCYSFDCWLVLAGCLMLRAVCVL